MSKPITFSICREKIDRTRIYTDKSGNTWYDFVAWPQDDPKYGKTHIVYQSKKKDEDVKLPICGNLTLPDAPKPASKPSTPPAQAGDDMHDDDVRF